MCAHTWYVNNSSSKLKLLVVFSQGMQHRLQERVNASLIICSLGVGQPYTRAMSVADSHPPRQGVKRKAKPRANTFVLVFLWRKKKEGLLIAPRGGRERCCRSYTCFSMANIEQIPSPGLIFGGKGRKIQLMMMLLCFDRG